MKIVFASDSFKESLASAEVNAILAQCAREVFPDCTCREIAIADGGEGTLEAMVAVRGGRYVLVRAHDALLRECVTRYAVIGDTAVICLAEINGLAQLAPEQRDPLAASTYGTGELIAHALAHGHRKLIVTLGGSATNDGGMGCLTALGARFRDGDGNVLCGSGAELGRVARVELDGLDPRLADTELTVMCDVDNVLTGPHGATRTYGAQKGATVEILDALEEGMEHFARVLGAAVGIDLCAIRGGGAAGGIGAALVGVLGGRVRAGIDVLLDAAQLDRELADADLVVTGEGKVDGQTVHGKVVKGIADRAKRAGVPLCVVAGRVDPSASALYECGVTEMHAITPTDMPLPEALRRAPELLRKTAHSIFAAMRRAQYGTKE